MTERNFCFPCGVDAFHRATLGGPCVVCGGPEPPGPQIVVKNDNRAKVYRKIYDRMKVERPMSFLGGQVDNVSWEQFQTWMEGDEAHWHLIREKAVARGSIKVYSIIDYMTIKRFTSLHIPCTRKPPDHWGRARDNLMAYPSGSLGVIVPPLVCTFKKEQYGGVVEESVHLKYHLCVVTGVGASVNHEIGLASNYPHSLDNRKVWPAHTPYPSTPEAYILECLKTDFADREALAVAGLDSMVVNGIHECVAQIIV